MSTRAAVAKSKSVRKLPFSPRKTRSRKLFAVQDSDEESDEEDNTPAPTRRSIRARKTDTIYVPDDVESISDEADDDEDYSQARSKHKPRPKKKIIRRATYGYIRNIADLEYDSHSDEETAPFRVHREMCEKCHRQPAHTLLELERKKGNKKRKRDADDFESDTDEEKLNALGGWVRW
jgi:hypothetical protein